MPTLTRWFLRAAMVCLVAGLAIGVLMVTPAGPVAELAASLRPVYIHLLVLGWATQMVFGVAYWMFPRRSPVHGFGSPVLGWTCFCALNAGLLLRAVAEPAVARHSGGLPGGVLLVAAILQLIAVVAFVAIAWRRVVAR